MVRRPPWPAEVRAGQGVGGSDRQAKVPFDQVYNTHDMDARSRDQIHFIRRVGVTRCSPRAG